MAVRRKNLIIAAVLGLAAAAAVLMSGGPSPEEARLAAEARARYAAALPRAEAGDVDAQFAVAEALRHGQGVARNLDEAVKWYRKAADKAQVGAQYALGTLHEAGEGVPLDYARAAEWYRLAANIGGQADAEFALARLYYNGRGVASDPDEAVTLFRKAANRGHAAAQYVLGTIYESGWNVQADPIEAYKWFTLAIPNRAQAMALDKGYDPQAARDRLKVRMNDFQVMRGEQAAAAWRPVRPAQNLGREGVALLPRAVAPAPAEALKPPPRTAVRLYAFDLPGRPEGAEPLPVSLLVEVAGAEEKAWACGVVPRIRDAVTQALWSQPPAAGAGPPDLRALDGRLAGPVNQVLGLASPRQVFLYPGDRPLTVNDAMRTPFAAVEDCVLSAKPAK